ncbi:hypothetical protein [Rhodococcus sp. NPDC004095]
MSGFAWDPYARENIGRRRGSLPDPVAEYEASGRFRSDPSAAPDPDRVAALLARLGLANGGRTNLHDGSPVVDQWEAHRRFAESFSPGHQRVRSPLNPNATLGDLFPHIIGGHRKPGPLARGDISQQVDPLDKRPALIGDDRLGTLHVPVVDRNEVESAVRGQFAPRLRKESWCGFCMKKQVKLGEIQFLLRGHSFWIHVSPACGRCHGLMDESAERIGVELTWIAHPSADAPACP